MRRLWLFLLLASIVYNGVTSIGRDDGPRRPDPGIREHGAIPDVIIIEMEETQPDSTGSAFLIDDSGVWMTARHVVDRCSAVAIRMNGGALRHAQSWVSHHNADAALIYTGPRRTEALPLAGTVPPRKSPGYVFGFPQGRPGDVKGILLGSSRQRITGRYNTRERVLVWAERRRVPEFRGELGGASGSPLVTDGGQVAGVMSSASLRRGRFYTVAPPNLLALIESHGITPRAQSVARRIQDDRFWKSGEQLRSRDSVAQVFCRRSFPSRRG